MLLCKRPDKPDGFDDAVKDAKEKIQKLIDNKKQPKSDEFDPDWVRFKAVLSKAQNARCGFCDTTTNDSVGDIEHFRPKAGVDELSDDPTTWAVEIPGTSNAEGRQFTRRIQPGYWWLAYEWSNLLIACERCNGPWKRCLFPVAEGLSRQWPPQKDGPEETSLLLHCYGTENPSKHLLFEDDDLGSVKAVEGSRHGWETIKTCGLDRQTLRTRRLDLVPRVYALIREISDHGFDRPAGKTALRDLLAMGNPKDRDMPGIVRIIAEQTFDKSWEQLEKYAF